MRIRESIVFRGPSHWSTQPTIELRLELQGRTVQDVSKLASLIDRLQAAAGPKLKPLPLCVDGVQISLPIEFEEEALTRECIKASLRLLNESDWREVDITTFEERRLVDMADDLRLGPSSRAILDAATARGISFHRMNRGSLVQLGEGVHQRRIWTAETDATSAIAEAIASDKQLTRSILESIGVNVPLGCLVADAEEAWVVAQQIGLPVVVKPCNANHARGVSLELNDREAILAAYDCAKVQGETDQIMVEQFIVGDHHRLLVVGGRMVAASRGQREFVVGNGRLSITELVAELNEDPRRGENYTDQLDIVHLSEAAAIVLAKQGFDFHSVPTAGERVLIKHVGDLIEDCTDIVHPTTAETAVLAARAVGLDVAGLDVVVTDISKPLADQRGGIVEVNAGPSLSSHVSPLRGKPRPVGDAIIEMLFPGRAASAIPIIVVLSQTGETQLARQLFQSQLNAKNHFAMLSRTRIMVNGKSLPSSGDSHRDVRGILGHPFVEGIVLELSFNELLAHGFPCKHSECVIVDSRSSQQSSVFAGGVEQRFRQVFLAINNLNRDNGQVIVLADSRDSVIGGIESLDSLRDRVSQVDGDDAVYEIVRTILN
jgi:cyanophycin synthetase